MPLLHVAKLGINTYGTENYAYREAPYPITSSSHQQIRRGWKNTTAIADVVATRPIDYFSLMYPRALLPHIRQPSIEQGGRLETQHIEEEYE